MFFNYLKSIFRHFDWPSCHDDDDDNGVERMGERFCVIEVGESYLGVGEHDKNFVETKTLTEKISAHEISTYLKIWMATVYKKRETQSGDGDWDEEKPSHKATCQDLLNK